ncbi:luciferase-type oxidoreductase, BA3436 family [Microbulbifer thermotolerans]|uniref:TIGR03571 family LLM class oxidoreductase n=1 Tax=Microbulbifer thermotolerans TaxID=252514 RepID=UPI0008E27FE2|nr:TIGR03571 family LLM class oxidoreductase [Microbulbifer thermotolerans]SFC10464.1 luciferase-type oxidoreductase, BA3436 family [Microbulbifer thermotolerans]
MNLSKLTSGPLTIGVELPLDNDWTSDGQRQRLLDKRPFGVPDLSAHQSLAMQADELGFRALWVRDVPLYDPSFGDAAQVFDPLVYLGFLSGVTRNILLGTAAIVLPLRNPWIVRKSAASVQALSGNRLLLGIASGDRPSEYPLFGADYETRGQDFRHGVEILTGKQDRRLAPGQAILPETQPPPLLSAGLSQQSPQWIGEHMSGWLAYPGTPEEHMRRVALWRNVAGDKPYVSFIHLDYLDDAKAPRRRHRFGVQTGRDGLLRELEEMQSAGVNHIGLHFRRNQAPVADTLMRVAEDILGVFHETP